MIEVDKAISLICQQAEPTEPAIVLASEAMGQVLAEDIISDIDSPPHDKALVDGYAIIAADMTQGQADLSVLEEITAGMVPTKSVRQGTATRIMTGAPLPKGADTVVMIEQTELVEADAAHPTQVRICCDGVKANQNIMPRALSMQRGEVVLKSGLTVRPIEIGLLGEVGRKEIKVHARPRVAVLSTGDELVLVEKTPSLGQIRNSNGPMLQAFVQSAGGVPIDLGIGGDDRSELFRLIQKGLQHDVLVLSGGVSAGVLDLVPAVLSEAGVQQVFHKVNLKPGKPIWFGVLKAGQRNKLVFGLPGNPVSSFVCFELFVRPALSILLGKKKDRLPMIQAELICQHHQKSLRPTFFPAAWQFDGNRLRVKPLAWHGSADLQTLTQANCLAYFPGGERLYSKGETVLVYQFSS